MKHKLLLFLVFMVVQIIAYSSSYDEVDVSVLNTEFKKIYEACKSGDFVKAKELVESCRDEMITPYAGAVIIQYALDWGDKDCLKWALVEYQETIKKSYLPMMLVYAAEVGCEELYNSYVDDIFSFDYDSLGIKNQIESKYQILWTFKSRSRLEDQVRFFKDSYRDKRLFNMMPSFSMNFYTTNLWKLFTAIP